MNTLIKILNENGYKNTDTNRQRAVKNLNLLLDSGVLKLTFVDAETYNAKVDGRGFWFDGKDGKRYVTAYKVTIFGKTFNGHAIPKSKTTKWCSAINFDGTREYQTDTEYFNNTRISVDSIQTRVAQLIKIVKEKEDFLTPRLFQAKGECSCSKCHGNGIILAFAYYANGVCFDCGGSGIDRNTLKSIIQESVNNALI